MAEAVAASSTFIEDGYLLGIDLGTQGLTALLVQADASLTVVATGEASYGFIPNLEDGSYEQNAQDWEDALVAALKQVHDELLSTALSSSPMAGPKKVLAVCVAGQMHGQVMVNSDGNVIGTVRLWCDARNEEEAEFLTRDLFHDHSSDRPVKIPKRATVARWLWTIRNQPELARQCAFLTTPAGWLTYRLTGGSCRNLGIGDASGMFPIDDSTLTYRQDLLEVFDNYIDETYNDSDHKFPRLSELLPDVLVAGQAAGRVVDSGGLWPHDLLPPGTVVAPAEGDQPASLAGSLIGATGMISCSFGTSVVANMVMPGGQTASEFVISPAVDHFCAANGQPIYMVWLRNGTTFMNTMAASFGGNLEELMSEVVKAPVDCGGLLALPFLDDEPGLDVKLGGTALVIGYNNHNNTPGNVIKAALTSVMYNLYLGTSKLEPQSNTPTTSLATVEEWPHIVLTGGLTKTPETGQILADIFDRNVRLLEGADEGCAWGAAVLANYTFLCSQRRPTMDLTRPEQEDWAIYLNQTQAKYKHEFSSKQENAVTYRHMLHKYQQLLEVQRDLDKVMNARKN